jgi:copper chaperone CopZ
MALKALEITGMSCSHCVKAVTLALQDVPGVHVEDVTVGRAVVDVDEQVATAAQLARAIDEAGFTLADTRDVGR